MDYDVIIAGGSFAGLAVAAQLRGKHVLLVEPNAIGAVQTSACATLLAVLEATGTMDSLLQVHNRFVLHLADRTYEIPLLDPFCTFDYRTFCQRLLARSNAEILQASVLGHHGRRVHTTRGAFDAGLLVDATGWRAALARNARQQAHPRHGQSFGMETTVPVQEEGLHFWYQPGRLLPKGVTWLFPVGQRSRAGIASYEGETRLKTRWEEWLCAEFGQSPNGIHGGYFPYRRRPATTGRVFRVGDAAGQCLPFTGEGIRPALYFGAAAGKLALSVIEGRMTDSAALALYRRHVNDHVSLYYFLLFTQKFLTNIPVVWVERLVTQIQRRNLLPFCMDLYRRLMDPAKIVVPDTQAEEIPLLRPERVRV